MARATNKHHLWYPSTDYKTPLELKFRRLPCNIVVLQVAVHDLLHACSEPPTKPTEAEMFAVVRNHQTGRCPCNPEKSQDGQG